MIIKLFQGLLIGFALIIPGLSGGVLAILFGVYEMIINFVDNPIKSFKENKKDIIFLILGGVISLVLGTLLLSYFLKKYEEIIVFLFTGFILGGIPAIISEIEPINCRKISNIILFFCVMIFTLLFSIFVNEGNYAISILSTKSYIDMFLVGVIISASIVIPGISGTAILVILGIYGDLLIIINNIIINESFYANVIKLIPIICGLIVGIIIFTKTMKVIFNKHYQKMTIVISAFLISTVLSLLHLYTIRSIENSENGICLCYSFLVLGLLISLKMNKKIK